MLDKESAQQFVLKYINDNYHIADDELVVVDEYTIEKEYGWVFFYESKRYLETGSFSDRVLGNVPILVEKQGKLHPFGSVRSVEEYLIEYENSRS
ncbi:YrhB domain-containing protein [Leptolyngbya sp. GGD]|uniref:YrhB domain-containing protein n=1 Tax=Leptolyngbya sp. GGD TaxID=2997907 RepID=UPI00227B1DA3|nr:YrhB domain-containing protein [Leptolyngbya sp. GGD]MCY6493928.1 YrhB domain-containing protein [Leptolyngbya sp. GGD]